MCIIYCRLAIIVFNQDLIKAVDQMCMLLVQSTVFINVASTCRDRASLKPILKFNCLQFVSQLISKYFKFQSVIFYVSE